MSSIRKRPFRMAGTLLVLALVVGGCSSDASDEASDPSTTIRAATTSIPSTAVAPDYDSETFVVNVALTDDGEPGVEGAVGAPLGDRRVVAAEQLPERQPFREAVAQRRPEAGGGQPPDGHSHRRGEVQHVDGAAAPHLAVDQLAPEGIVAPARRVGRHDVGVAHQQQGGCVGPPTLEAGDPACAGRRPLGAPGGGDGGGGAAAIHVITRLLRDLLLGKDPADVRSLWDEMYRATLPYGRKGLTVMAISGVDLALWDLLGRAEGVPVYELLGGRRKERVRAYATGPDSAWYAELGYTAHKLPHRRPHQDTPDYRVLEELPVRVVGARDPHRVDVSLETGQAVGEARFRVLTQHVL